MGKSKRNEALNQSPDAQISPAIPAPAPAPDFSNGELGQLQEILYGAQQRANNEQIATLQLQVTEQIQTMTNMFNSRLNLLTESIEKTTNTFEQKISELRSEQIASTKNISQTMDDKNKQIESSITLLGQSTGEETARIHTELKSVETQLQSQLRETHESLQLEMTSSVDQLQSKKLDRQNLAQLLGEVSEQLAASGSATIN